MLLSKNLTKPSLRRRIILYTFSCLAFISFVGGVFVDYYFSQHNPRRPEPEVAVKEPEYLARARVTKKNKGDSS